MCGLIADREVGSPPGRMQMRMKRLRWERMAVSYVGKGVCDSGLDDGKGKCVLI